MSPEFIGVIAFLGGLIPALIWLAFWLLEDRCKPEPKWRLFLTFVVGMLAVGIALPLERFFIPYLMGSALIFTWAIFEELLKFGVAYAVGIASKAYDEPIDAVVYLITAALGFSAAENALFLIAPLADSTLAQVVMTGDLRFVGATLLHTLSSAIIGIALGFSFYRSSRIKWIVGGIGVILAILLHSLFNFFILMQGGIISFAVFVGIWIGIAAVIFSLERLKRLQPLS